MIFNSSGFLIFFPFVTMIYYVLPQKTRYIWLLISSYFFYMCWDIEYAFLILGTTVVTYLAGVVIERIRRSLHNDREGILIRRIVLATAILINLVILFCFKYLNFAVAICRAALGKMGISLDIPEFDIILPVGISFYTFQAIGYVIDVYRETVYAEKNFFKYALFISFFPQLVAGPIERSKNLMKQLAVPHSFAYEKARDGLYLVLWGFFLKIVLADRIAILVDTVYSDYRKYPGFYIVLATVLFAVQIYCDFAGYSTIAIGTAKILGIELMENFNAPYFSTSVSEFWRKWHISLTSWFKDYVYIPLGGSRKGNTRKQINKVIVFLVSGLWHGASFSFVVWGGLNGIYQVVGDLLMPLRNRAVRFFHLNRNSYGHKLVSACITFLLVDFSWLFFRAKSTSEAFEMVKSIFQNFNPWILFDESIYNCGLDLQNFWVMIASVGVLFVSDYLKHKGVVMRKRIMRQDYWFRCIFVDAAVIFILIFGIWGSTYDSTSFIYFQF